LIERIGVLRNGHGFQGSRCTLLDRIVAVKIFEREFAQDANFVFEIIQE
jgi:hypothetical protein